MKLTNVLKEYNFPQNAIDILSDSGIQDLYPPQAQAIEKGALKGNNLLMSVPTAAGKTLIAELCMLKSILQDNGRCLYIAPLKALASEKYEDFKKKYSKLGIKVGISTGDLDSPSRHLNRYQILIATAEKVDSLLRSKAQWLISSLNVVILDEIHFINDGSRGPTMEVLTARIMQMNSNVQILALSATVSNALEIAKWLKAELVHSDWRPIPLKEGVYFNEAIQFDNYGTKLIREEEHDDLGKIVLDTLRGKGQVLVFVSSRRSAQAASRQISSCVTKITTPEEKKILLKISKDIASSANATKICQKLAGIVACGAAFHHAGLKPQQRKLIEENFKKNIIKVICSTPTLAAGVNLPARRTVMRDLKRYESGLGATYIPASEYKQCAGRAGRPQYDDVGEAVMMAKSFSESQVLFDRYIHAKPEPVISKLSNESVLRIHVLASIAGGYVHDVKGMFEFISHTFLAHQRNSSNLLGLIGEIFDFLTEEGFIKKEGFHFFATALGQCTSRLYIDPFTSIILRNGLNEMKKKRKFSPIGALHLLCCCPDMPILKSISKKIYEDLEMFAGNFQDEFILRPANSEILDDFNFYLATIKTTWMLSHWIDEEKEDYICDKFNVGPGDIYRHVESAQWLLHACVVMSQLFDLKQLSFQVEDLRKRVRYGIGKELLEIAQLKGVGRIRARNLYNKGFKKLSDLKFSNADDLSKIGQIGKTLAKDIIEQVSYPIRKKRASIYTSSNT